MIAREGVPDMCAKTTVVVALSLMLRATAQDFPKVQTQCRFADGKIISVTASDVAGSVRLTTDESLVTVNGIRVAPGTYIVSPSKDARNHWTLTMKKASWSKAPLPPIPMSVSASASPIGNVAITFDQTGGSCTMRWGIENSNVLLSLEFTERNTDMPVLP
jgi:hypothetical protein